MVYFDNCFDGHFDRYFDGNFDCHFVGHFDYHFDGHLVVTSMVAVMGTLGSILGSLSWVTFVGRFRLHSGVHFRESLSWVTFGSTLGSHWGRGEAHAAASSVVPAPLCKKAVPLPHQIPSKESLWL